jgi:hypothetical protein
MSLPESPSAKSEVGNVPEFSFLKLLDARREPSIRADVRPEPHLICLVLPSAYAKDSGPSVARYDNAAAGCDDFDTKSVNFERLLQKIHAVLGR